MRRSGAIFTHLPPAAFQHTAALCKVSYGLLFPSLHLICRYYYTTVKCNMSRAKLHFTMQFRPEIRLCRVKSAGYKRNQRSAQVLIILWKKRTFIASHGGGWIPRQATEYMSDHFSPPAGEFLMIKLWLLSGNQSRFASEFDKLKIGWLRLGRAPA